MLLASEINILLKFNKYTVLVKLFHGLFLVFSPELFRDVSF